MLFVSCKDFWNRTFEGPLLVVLVQMGTILATNFAFDLFLLIIGDILIDGQVTKTLSR